MQIKTLADILSERFTLKDLILKDKIADERKSLKDVVLEMEDEVLANAGVDVFEEVFKLIFTKLYDEYQSRQDKRSLNRIYVRQSNDNNLHENSPQYLDAQDYGIIKTACQREYQMTAFRLMEFRNTGQTDTELKEQDSAIFSIGQKRSGRVFFQKILLLNLRTAIWLSACLVCRTLNCSTPICRWWTKLLNT